MRRETGSPLSYYIMPSLNKAFNCHLFGRNLDNFIMQVFHNYISLV